MKFAMKNLFNKSEQILFYVVDLLAFTKETFR